MTEPTPDATILDIAAPPLLAYYPVKPEELTLVSSEDDRHASYALPPGWTLQTVDNESKQPNPRRARGNVDPEREVIDDRAVNSPRDRGLTPINAV